MTKAEQNLYAGLSYVTYDGEPFDLGHGVKLSSAYAHLFAPHLMAFARAEAGNPHPGPWRPVRGGFGYDIEAEIAVTTTSPLPGNFTAEDAIWLISALLRLVRYPYLMVPVLSDHAFDVVASTPQEPLLRPFEIEPRILRLSENEQSGKIKESDLQWVKSIWPNTIQLLQQNPSLNMALRAADACTIRARPASALLAAWGALEELFAPSRAELRFRVSAHIAAFLEPSGPKRLELFKTVASLYNARSKAAHSAQQADLDALLQSFVILRNALVRIIGDGVVPTQASFEELLFSGEKAQSPPQI